MKSLAWILGLLLAAGAATNSAAQTALPLVEEVNLPALQAHGLNVRQALEKLGAPLPTAIDKQLQPLLKDKPQNADEAAAKIQELLDGYCLIGVVINPESRVKALRGPAAAELTLDRETIVLVKIQNDAGVSAAPAVAGDQLRLDGKAEKGRWLEAGFHGDKPLARNLSGQRVEYAILKLTPREAGKREATLQFDIGQGTQDLGFRAEVPILFTIRKPK